MAGCREPDGASGVSRLAGRAAGPSDEVALGMTHGCTHNTASGHCKPKRHLPYAWLVAQQLSSTAALRHCSTAALRHCRTVALRDCGTAGSVPARSESLCQTPRPLPRQGPAEPSRPRAVTRPRLGRQALRRSPVEHHCRHMIAAGVTSRADGSGHMPGHITCRWGWPGVPGARCARAPRPGLWLRAPPGGRAQPGTSTSACSPALPPGCSCLPSTPRQHHHHHHHHLGHLCRLGRLCHPPLLLLRLRRRRHTPSRAGHRRPLPTERSSRHPIR